MEKQIVTQILSTNSFKSIPQQNKHKIQTELLKQFNSISATAKELGINIDELWKVHIAKCEYNQFDTREKRHVMYTTQEEKNILAEKEKVKLQKEYVTKELQITVNGYDITTQQKRTMNREAEYALAFFQNQEGIDGLSSMVPPYFKFKVLKCTNLYVVNIPNQCISQFPGIFVVLAPIKKTVIIGIEGYSPNLEIENITMHLVGQLRIWFISADIAEQIDENHANKFWFYENYNPKRRYHFIYSNSRK
jgi:hypothetical protein